MKLVILSDIHANPTALRAIIDDIKHKLIDKYKVVVLGDTINYGLQPNVTLDIIRELNPFVLLAGNHEMALFGIEDDRFSSARGKEILEVTKKLIDDSNIRYIEENFEKKPIDMNIDGKRYLFIHGSLSDIYWGTIKSSTDDKVYVEYDIVFSGHSHKPHYFENFYEVDHPEMRNKKKTIFINPGSVGQPRNHDHRSQYVIFDTENLNIEFCKVEYDYVVEQKVIEAHNVDKFYSTRLEVGI